MMRKTLYASIFGIALLNNAYSLPTPSYENVPRYIVALDGQTYFGTNAPFFQGDRPLPDGYKVVVRCYKAKGDINSYIGDFGAKWEAEKQKALNAKEILADSEWEEFEKYCAENLDMNDFKDYEPQAEFSKFIADGYLPTFRSYWALKAPAGEILPAMWILDPNHKALTDIAKKPGDKTPILVWKNPEYKEPDVATCAPGEGAAGAVDAATNSSAISKSSITESFVFEGSDFKQSFQVVGSAEKPNPEGVKEITARLARLFNDMPKVGSTIIGLMIKSDGSLGMCQVICEIDGKTLKANLMFDVDTTADQGRKLAGELDEKFSILKKRFLEESKDKVAAKQQMMTEEYNRRLAALDQQEKQAADVKRDNVVNVTDVNNVDAETALQGDAVSETANNGNTAEEHQEEVKQDNAVNVTDVDAAGTSNREHSENAAEGQEHQEAVVKQDNADDRKAEVRDLFAGTQNKIAETSDDLKKIMNSHITNSQSNIEPLTPSQSGGNFESEATEGFEPQPEFSN